MVDAAEDPSALLNILLRDAVITPEMAMQAVDNQGPRFIGQALIEFGYITEAQLELALLEQRAMREKNVSKKQAIGTLLDNYANNQAKVTSATRDLVDELRLASEKILPIKRTT